MSRQSRPAGVGWRVGIPILLAVAVLAPGRWLDAGPLLDDPDGFAAQVAAHFDEWDLDHDGALSFRELAALVPDTRIRGEAACALAAIHQVQRGKDPVWRNAAFTRDELIGSGSGLVGHRPPVHSCYRRRLAHLRATRRELFAPGAPDLRGIHQGPLGDCFLIATVGAVIGRDPTSLRAMVGQMPDGSYLVRFPGGPVIPVPSVSDAEILLGSSDDGQGIWLNVIEKAYGELVLACHRREGTPIDVLSAAGSMSKTLKLFTGRDGLQLRFRPHGSPHVPGHAAVAELATRARAIMVASRREGRLMCCDTPTTATPPGIAPKHCYAVLGYDEERDIVHLWNPWGNHFTPRGTAGRESGYPVQDGQFSVPMGDFVRIFAALSYESRRTASRPWTRPK